MVTSRDDVVGLDSSVILPARGVGGVRSRRRVQRPAGRVPQLSQAHRQDHLQEAYAEKKGLDNPDERPDRHRALPGLRHRRPVDRAARLQHDAQDLPRPGRDEEGLHYLRPETAQGIFVNFANVLTTSRKKPPFGIGQIGKSFRNEITPGNFIFRTREFEQMEMEFFVKPGEDEEWHQYWIDYPHGLVHRPRHQPGQPAPVRARRRTSSRTTPTRTVDIEYRFRFQGSEWGELEGVANRTDFDLSTHSKHSGTDLNYYDQATGERYTPYVIEPAAGLTRSLMAFLVDAYTEDEAPNAKGGVDKRTVLRLDRRLAPVKAAVLPLSVTPT